MNILKHTFLLGLLLTGCTLATGAPDPSPTPTFPPTTSPAPATPPPGAVASPAAITSPPATAPPTPTPIQVANALPDTLASVDTNRLIISVNQLANLTNRHILGSGGQTARDSLFAAFQAIQQPGMDIFMHPFTFTFADQTITAHNVVLVIRGSDPAAGAVIVGAHYDTRSTDPAAADTLQPGADDNASGVAAVLEVTRLMAGRTPRAPVICVLFAAEEQGRFGSRAFVRDVIEAQGMTVQAMLNLDVVGSPTGPDGVSQMGVRVYSAPPDGSPSRQLARQIAQITADHVPGLVVDVRDTLDRPGRWGDHQSFSDAGFAAVRLIEPFDDPNRVHNLNDTPDHVDPVYLRAVTQVVLAAVLVLAG